MSAITFTISVNFRETQISATKGKKVIWQSEDGHFSGIDLILTLMEYMRRQHTLLVGRYTSEKALIGLGSALPLEEEYTIMVRGRDLSTGFPASKEISTIELRNAIRGQLEGFAKRLDRCLKDPEIKGLIMGLNNVPSVLKPALAANPLMLTGEFARLKRLDKFLQNALGLKVILQIPDTPS